MLITYHSSFIIVVLTPRLLSARFSSVVRLTVIFLALALGMAFLGFRDFLPGIVALLAKVLFVLLTLAGLITLNAAILRKPPQPDDTAPRS